MTIIVISRRDKSVSYESIGVDSLVVTHFGHRPNSVARRGQSRLEVGGTVNHLLGKVLADTRLCRVTKVIASGKTFYRKQRHSYATILIWGAETFLRPPFHVLSERDWLDWEPQLYRRFYGLAVEADSTGRLTLPALPGLVLTDYLRLTGDAGLKMQAFEAALRALWQLHQTQVCFPCRVEALFSHGDATARNVIYDPIKGQARWFDFETMHDLNRPRAWRQADDLRAFTYSTVAHLSGSSLSEAARCVISVYADPLVLRELSLIVERVRHKPDLFHLAQADINKRQSSLWADALQYELQKSPLSSPGK